jgi:predicted P-loop ATPase
LLDKDERLKLHRFWFIEWAELEALFRRKDISTVKAFITTAYDNIRPPYGRQTATYHRRSIIVGTTNEDDFLRDPTGNRRFWVIPVQKSIPIDLLEQERDRIWAAAVHAYRAQEQWHLGQEEAAEAVNVASRFEDYDPWESYIEQWLEATGRESYSINEILAHLFGLSI